MFRSARRLLQELAPERVQERLVLEVGLCPTISRAFATQRLLALFRMHNVLPRVRHGRYDALLEGLLGGELDLVLSENRPSRADEPRVGLRELVTSPLTFVASPKLAAGMRDLPRELGKRPFLHYTRDSRYRWDVDSYFREHDTWPEVVAEADDVVLLVAAAAAGVGVAAVPRAVASERLQLGELVELGTVNGASAVVYAHFQQIDPSELVRSAVEALAG
jgi:DNA-binding transcriptional LysR family regulator